MTGPCPLRNFATPVYRHWRFSRTSSNRHSLGRLMTATLRRTSALQASPKSFHSPCFSTRQSTVGCCAVLVNHYSSPSITSCTSCVKSITSSTPAVSTTCLTARQREHLCRGQHSAAFPESFDSSDVETLVVVGGGAAGVFGALRAKELAPHLTVVVLDKAQPLGKVRRRPPVLYYGDHGQAGVLPLPLA